MKSIFSFFFCVLLLLGCKDENALLVNDISGSWTMSKLSLLGANPDNFPLPSQGTITFEACDGKMEAGDKCPGSFTLDADPATSFTFSAFSNGEQSINILADQSLERTYFLTGNWEIESRQENRLVMNGTLVSFDQEGNKASLHVRLDLQQ